ncbi:MAG TPA: helix-turn-helix transcriptional regulator [Jatrophihabitans sp.]|nr:helix-turn-helix transcriptional regulator [Jatrophihabitans sp.]
MELFAAIRRDERVEGLSIRQLAERANLHWAYIGQVERGRRNLTLHNILKLATALDVDPGRLIRGLTPPSDG